MVADKIEQEITINAPRQKVWKALTTAAGIKVWYAFGGVDLDLRVGGKIVFRWDEHGAYYGVIEALEPEARFSFRLAPFNADAEPVAGNSTLVTFELTSDDDTTHVAFTESGYTQLAVADAEKAENYATSEGAWADSLSLLKSRVEST